LTDPRLVDVFLEWLPMVVMLMAHYGDSELDDLEQEYMPSCRIEADRAQGAIPELFEDEDHF